MAVGDGKGGGIGIKRQRKSNICCQTICLNKTKSQYGEDWIQLSHRPLYVEMTVDKDHDPAM
jgi:hypothetical protein